MHKKRIIESQSQTGMEGLEGTFENHLVQPPHAMGTNILHKIRVLKATSLYKDILTFSHGQDSLMTLKRFYRMIYLLAAERNEAKPGIITPAAAYEHCLSQMDKNISQCQQNCIARKK